MPIHEWKCSKCEKITEVVRTLKDEDYARKPRGKERACECKAPKYFKVLTSPPDEKLGDNWGAGKGNW